MEILGIGPQELVFIIIIALIVLGPKDMQRAGRTIGRWLNQLVRSDSWKAFQRTSRELQNLPTTLMRQANMEIAEVENEIRKATDFQDLNTPIKLEQPKPDQPVTPQPGLSQPTEPEHRIEPPIAQPEPQTAPSEQPTSSDTEAQ